MVFGTTRKADAMVQAKPRTLVLSEFTGGNLPRAIEPGANRIIGLVLRLGMRNYQRDPAVSGQFK